MPARKPVSVEKGEGNPVFEHLLNEDGSLTLKIDSQMSLTQRRDNSYFLPKVLSESRLLFNREYEAIGWQEVQPDKVVSVLTPSGPRAFAYQYSQDGLQQMGLLARVHALAQKMLDTEETLARISQPTHVKKKGHVYLIGPTRMPHSGANVLHLGRLAKKLDDWDGQEIINELTELSDILIKAATAGLAERGKELRNIQMASFTLGKSDTSTCIQVNFSDPNINLKHSIKKFGGPHVDVQDCPTDFTCMFNLSNLPEDFFGGRFLIAPARIVFVLRSCEALIFSGNSLHCNVGLGKYSVPKDSPFRLPRSVLDPVFTEGTPEWRLTVPVFPSEPFLEPRFKWVSSEMYTAKAAKLSGSAINHKNWMMQTFIRHEAQIRGLLKLDATPRDQNDTAETGPELLTRANKICTELAKAKAKKFNADTEERKQKIQAMKEAGQESAARLPAVKRQHDDLVDGAITEQPAKKLKTSKAGSKTHDKQTASAVGAFADSKQDEPSIKRQTAKYYARLFNASEEVAQKALDAASQSNQDYGHDQQDVAYIDCGRGFMRRKNKDGTQVERVTWTHEDLSLQFEAGKDVIARNSIKDNLLADGVR